jgi:ribosomal protein S18 acetylase RimI-like enzyme
MTFSIRSATRTDIPALLELLGELFSIEVDFTPDSAKQERGLKMLLDRGEQACVLVAIESGRVVGMITAQVLVSTAEGADVALIEDLVVTQAARGRGIGHNLLGAMQEWCADRGLARMQLLADQHNTPAQEFYRRQRWAETQLVAWRKYSDRT